MRWVVYLGTVVVMFNVGVMAGAFMAYVATSRNSVDIWEVTNAEGCTYYVYDADEVAMALQVDGMLAVRRLRVLV